MVPNHPTAGDDEYYDRLRARADRALAGADVGEFVKRPRTRAIVGARRREANYPELAADVLRLLRAGSRPTPEQLAALEAVIRVVRPSKLSAAGRLADLTAEEAAVFPSWRTFQAASSRLLYSIGRIDLVLRAHPLETEPFGTGFLVSSRALVTNGHVLDAISSGTSRLTRGQAVVRFRYEHTGTSDPVADVAAIDVVGVLARHETLDIAVLEVTDAPAVPSLEIDAAVASVGAAVVAVGYPLPDPRNPRFASAIFGQGYGVKRGAPGEIIDAKPERIFHDCSTLGGNSGSPLLSMETARVVGLHHEGFLLSRNRAVDSAALGAFVQPYL